jgi:serine/threonine-protein kinase
MALTIGTQLGSHEITALLGKGGMGEVYRARDLKLKREVAIKILPDEFGRDEDRLSRFQREAEVLASLNHPNIAGIYDLQETNGSRYLVLELVEGETLADRIAHGPIPLADALSIAAQICEALEAAHERGIIHRDLKPANVKLTPDGKVKVLDFGLSKSAETELSDLNAGLSNSPTLMSMAATNAGIILGTAGYMSPEQASGKRVDKRSDVWSFGVVLWEMLTGERLFDGETVSHTLADVLRAPIDFGKVPAATPTAIRELLKRCLDRDVRTRLRDIGEAGIAISKYMANPENGTEGPRHVQARRVRAPWAIAVVLAVVAAVGWWTAWRATLPVDRLLMRLSVDLGPDAITGASITAAISPDGNRIAFPVRDSGGKQKLATRLLGQAASTVLSGTDNAADPFFSPDGQWIGFFADGMLKKISVLGGAALTLCDAPNARGASWGEDGNIITAITTAGGLVRVLATGGAPQTLTKPLERGERSHRWPKVLPGGNGVLFTASSVNGAYDDANIEVLSLKSGEIKILVRGGYFADYFPTTIGVGYLIYVHQGALYGVPFDPGSLELRGVPTPLLDDVAGNAGTGGGQLDVSRTGTIVYLSGKSSRTTWPVAWLDSAGKTQTLIATPGLYFTPRFSPDGNRLALSVNSNKGRDIYSYDWRHDTMPRLTFTGRANVLPVWTPDGRHIAYASSDGLWWVRADGAGEPQRLLETQRPVFTNSFSPDGRSLSYSETAPGTEVDIWILPLDLSDAERPKPGKPEPFLRTPANEAFSAFSPDGHWIAYTSDETGQIEVYVRPFPGPGGKWQVSTGGGSVPIWSNDGRELFYASLDERIMVTEYVVKGDSFSNTKPRLFSDIQINDNGNRYFDVHPDGKRFAVFPRLEAGTEKQGNLHITFMLNFADELRRIAPISKK